jgi:hypothetical protein
MVIKLASKALLIGTTNRICDLIKGLDGLYNIYAGLRKEINRRKTVDRI